MTSITSPSDIDILCGKDKTFNKHPGNLLYRQLIEKYAEGYSNESSKQIKMKVTKDIVCRLEASGARFIRLIGDNNTDGGWQEITNQQARDKTSHALRFCAATMLAKQQQQVPPATAHAAARHMTMATPINRRVIGKRAAKAKREHRRIVSNDYSDHHPFAQRNFSYEHNFMALSPSSSSSSYHHHNHHHHPERSYVSSSSMTMMKVPSSSSSSSDYDRRSFPSTPSSWCSVDEVNDDDEYTIKDEETSNHDFYYHPQDEEHDHYEGTSLSTEVLPTFLVPDQVASKYYYYATTPSSEQGTTTDDGDDDDDDLEHMLQEPLGVVSHEETWDHQFYRH
jgi:hypothetical protein